MFGVLAWFKRLREPAWRAAYRDFKAAGENLVSRLPINAAFYAERLVNGPVYCVLCGYSGVVQAVERFNRLHGYNLPLPTDHNWTYISSLPGGGFVIFLVGGPSTDQADGGRLLWDRGGMADEAGHLFFKDDSHWLPEEEEA